MHKPLIIGELSARLCNGKAEHTESQCYPDVQARLQSIVTNGGAAMKTGVAGIILWTYRDHGAPDAVRIQCRRSSIEMDKLGPILTKCQNLTRSLGEPRRTESGRTP